MNMVNPGVRGSPEVRKRGHEGKNFCIGSPEQRFQFASEIAAQGGVRFFIKERDAGCASAFGGETDAGSSFVCRQMTALRVDDNYLVAGWQFPGGWGGENKRRNALLGELDAGVIGTGQIIGFDKKPGVRGLIG